MRPIALVVMIVAGAITFGSTPAASAKPSTKRTTDASVQQAETGPSKKSRMICAREAQKDLAGVLGAKPRRVTTPTWSDQLYRCDYVYPQGTVTLSVKELADTAGTTAYFDTLASTLGRLPADVNLGQGAFETPNGSLAVRKDDSVLLVDVRGLANGFEKNALTAEDVAYAIAATILQCWKG